MIGPTAGPSSRVAQVAPRSHTPPGGTREAVDAVRYLGNRSSGKMGFAVAREAARRGAEVILVAGPSVLETPPGVAERGYQPVVVDLLRYLGALPGAAGPVPDALQRFWQIPIQNTRREPVGEVRSIVDWDAALPGVSA